MSLRKPIIKVTRECRYCKGSGKKDIKIEYPYLHKTGYYEIKIIACKKCNGIGRIDIKPSNSKFKKYYQKALEERVDDLTREYRYANTEAYRIGTKLKIHCEELDKVVNK